MKAKIYVTLKNGVLDPQGKAIESALDHLNFSGVEEARQGKFIELSLGYNDRARAEKEVAEMCEKLLANTVIENYTIELEEVA